MIIKIKKRALAAATLSLILAVILISIFIIPIVYAPTTNTTKFAFKAELVISNRAPSINVSNFTFAVDPVAADSIKVLISFNVTDADGAANINASKAVVNFTLGANAQYYANSSASPTSQFGTCGNHSPSATVVVINCSVVLPYYANSSANWVINISVPDNSGSVGRNDTLRFTINELSSISLPKTFMNFSNLNLGQQDASSNLVVNNTGNRDFDQINITAEALTGVTTSSETIDVTNFYVNITNSTAGQGAQLAATAVTLRALVQSSATSLDNATLLHGHSDAFAPNADKGNQTMYFWVDVPSSGLSPQVYNATWNITVNDLP